MPDFTNARNAFIAAGDAPFAQNSDGEILRAGEATADDVGRNNTPDRWLPTAQDIARRLPQIVAAQAAVATVQSATVAGIQMPSAAQLSGGGGFGVTGGTGGGLKGAFGEITGALGAARFVTSTALGIADFFGAPGQARSGDAFSIWQSLQQESLSNMGPSGRLAGRLRRGDDDHDPNEVRNYTIPGFARGPNSHGGKPAQGN